MQMYGRLPPKKRLCLEFLAMVVKRLCSAYSIKLHRHQWQWRWHHGCKTACLNICSCTPFAFIDSNSDVCKLWFGDLLSMRAKAISSDGQLLFIRLAASDVSQLSARAGRSISRVVALSISIPLGVAVLSSLFIGACFIQRKRRRLLEKFVKDDTPTSLRTFTYKQLKVATKNFAQKLGSILLCLQRNTARQYTCSREKIREFHTNRKAIPCGNKYHWKHTSCEFGEAPWILHGRV
ncbi:hypothetical protein SUGI_0664790 [Cryptomeria japonica]|nr:hypothetical protein SUGI_0664790 [Cryptomeria japonica]